MRKRDHRRQRVTGERVIEEGVVANNERESLPANAEGWALLWLCPGLRSSSCTTELFVIVSCLPIRDGVPRFENLFASNCNFRIHF